MASRFSGRALIIAIILGIFGLGGYLILQLQANNKRIPSILVRMPEVAPAGPESLRWFRLAVMDDLIHRLSLVPDVRVSGRETSIATRIQKDPREAAIDAGTIGVLASELSMPSEGSVALEVRLIDARDGKLQYSERFLSSGPNADAALAGLMLQLPAIGLKIVSHMNLVPTRGWQDRFAQPQTRQLEAWHRFELSQGQPDERVDGAVMFDLLQQALTMDADFVPALVAIALTQFEQGETHPDGWEDVVSGSYLIDRALRAHPDSGLALAAQGRFLALAHKFPESKAMFEKAVANAPGDWRVHEWYALYYHLPLTRVRQAAGALKRSLDLNPMDAAIQAENALPYYFTQQYVSGVPYLKRAQQLNPGNPLAQSYLELQQVWETIYPHPEPRFRILSQRKAPPLRREQALERLDEILEHMRKSRRVTALEYASILATRGLKEDAYYTLEQGVERRDPSLLWILTDPGLCGLRDEPRFKNLVKQLGITEPQ